MCTKVSKFLLSGQLYYIKAVKYSLMAQLMDEYAAKAQHITIERLEAKIKCA